MDFIITWILVGFGILWFISSLLLTWFCTFNSILYWLTVPEVFLLGGIAFPIAIIIGILDELNLPIKPATLVLFINNILGIMWTFIQGGYSFNNEVEIFGVVFSFSSTLGIILLFFIKQPEETKSSKYNGCL